MTDPLQLAVFFGLTMLIGLATWWKCRHSGDRSTDSNKEYFLASGGLSWFFVAGSITLTNLSPDEVSGVIPLAEASGSILHIRLFVSPRPGRTPIAETAVNATVRLAMLAEGDVGSYGGGGFIFPKGRPGDYTMRIELERASLTLTSSTAGFTDALGASLLDTRVTVRRDEPNAYRLADRFNLALERARGSE